MVFFVAFRAMSIGRKALEIDHRFQAFSLLHRDLV